VICAENDIRNEDELLSICDWMHYEVFDDFCEHVFEFEHSEALADAVALQGKKKLNVCRQNKNLLNSPFQLKMR
jgi:hypothetical protein